MGWEHKLIVLLHTVILVSVPGSTFLPRAKWKLQIHVVMKQFQYEHSAKNYKVGKTQSCVTAGWEGSALIKASSSLVEPFWVYWDHSVSVCWMHIRSYIKADLLWHCFDQQMRQLAEGSTKKFQEISFLCSWRLRISICFALIYTTINSYVGNWAQQKSWALQGTSREIMIAVGDQTRTKHHFICCSSRAWGSWSPL